MFRQKALTSLRTQRAATGARRALVGLDGFVDTIVTAVGQRRGPGTDFTAIPTITDFAKRLAAAAGKSTNVELYPTMEKLGGNGPIMAGALLANGSAVTYVGAVGHPTVHPVFAGLGKGAGRVHSLCAAAATTAIEFEDGKIMLGQMRSLDEVTTAKINEVVGADTFARELADAGLVAIVNWTMIPHATAIMRDLVEQVLPKLPKAPRRFFFDLADPEKRTADDLRGVLTVISRFEPFGRVTLGLNLKEAQQVFAVLGFAPVKEDEAGLRTMAADIRKMLAIDTVVVHPRESAACATGNQTYWVPGPLAEKPLITTGAGDHFNAGFVTGQVLGLDPEGALALGVCTSGHYVRTAKSPSLDDLEAFLANWR
jgi:sugar/nucleoside kinase (ribokinase family)